MTPRHVTVYMPDDLFLEMEQVRLRALSQGFTVLADGCGPDTRFDADYVLRVWTWRIKSGVRADDPITAADREVTQAISDEDWQRFVYLHPWAPITSYNHAWDLATNTLSMIPHRLEPPWAPPVHLRLEVDD